MKRSLLTVVSVLFLSGSVFAQGTSYNPPLRLLRDYYREASDVARVDVEDTVVLASDGFYYEFIASCRILESFKGNIRRGQSLKFSVRAENGYGHKGLRGDQIVFLKRFFDQKTRKYSSYQVFEDSNSTFPYSSATVASLRKIKPSAAHRRKENK
jgi:hypothetical protein